MIKTYFTIVNIYDYMDDSGQQFTWDFAMKLINSKLENHNFYVKSGTFIDNLKKWKKNRICEFVQLDSKQEEIQIGQLFELELLSVYPTM
jgi:hypothetical protein